MKLAVQALLLLFANYSLFGIAQHSQGQSPKQPSSVAALAKQYRMSMNLLLFPDYFMTEDQFADLKKSHFRDSNMQSIVAGLKAKGFEVLMPRSAKEYRDLVYPNILKCLKQGGFFAVEVPIGAANVEQCRVLRKVIEKLDLHVTAVGGTGDDVEKSLRHRVDCAHALGAKIVAGPVVLKFKDYPDEIGNARVDWVERRLADLVEPIRRAAAYAKTKDVKLAVEPLNRFELPGLNRLAHAIDFTKKVNHSHFGVMIDTCHEMSDGDGAEKYREQVNELMKMGKLFHCHISAIHRGRIDRGWFAWRDLFAPIFANGYNGNISLEIFDSAKPFSQSVHINRRPFDDPLEVALTSLRTAVNNLSKVDD